MKVARTLPVNKYRTCVQYRTTNVDVNPLVCLELEVGWFILQNLGRPLNARDVDQKQSISGYLVMILSMKEGISSIFPVPRTSNL